MDRGKNMDRYVTHIKTNTKMEAQGPTGKNVDRYITHITNTKIEVQGRSWARIWITDTQENKHQEGIQLESGTPKCRHFRDLERVS